MSPKVSCHAGAGIAMFSGKLIAVLWCFRFDVLHGGLDDCSALLVKPGVYQLHLLYLAPFLVLADCMLCNY